MGRSRDKNKVGAETHVGPEEASARGRDCKIMCHLGCGHWLVPMLQVWLQSLIHTGS